MSPLLIAPSHSPTILQLDSGITLIHQYLPATTVVVTDVWLRAGAIAEPEAWYGMAHFLEHMIFKGTETIPPGVFDRVVENRGGMTNAATSYDYAHFYLTTAAPYWEDTLPYLAELLLNAAIPEDEFDREREVVLEEIHACYDDPDWIGFQTLSESIYQQHPYGRSVLGTEIELMQHSPEAMRCFHRAHYQPENMTVAIAGGIETERAIEIVNCSFDRFLPRIELPPVELVKKPLLAGIRRQELYLPRLEQARLLMAWIAPGIDQWRSAYGLDLISVILGAGRSSRLIRTLREDKQLVQALSSQFSLLQDASLFTISVWLEPQHLEKVEELICAHLEQLQTAAIAPEELARAQRVLCNDYAFSTETPEQLAGLYGYYQTLGEPELATTYPQQIKSFDSVELQQIAQQYLSPYSYAVTVVKPC
ncbi:insulinase family protein [Chroococcidiopsis sp. FACHB-1243]|uniref:M16 family metallopeptidase n=1 Tax=Chroococcidiopsis sp. [FACHB-1243] TaxID=2692781 RepID=UPI00178566CE|nr:pitrilysin family protein [Chroococcidiopsis sp. [FACHB-1243]]MBD2308023.1 insulinase family protein [Chroococcidiopsis sp. [FACHB-1243]]